MKRILRKNKQLHRREIVIEREQEDELQWQQHDWDMQEAEDRYNIIEINDEVD